VRHSRPPFSGQHQKSSLGGCFIQRQTRTRTKDEFCLRLRCVESNTVTRFSEGAVRRTASTALSESKKKDTHLFGQSDRGRNHPPQPVIRSETPLFSFAGGKAAFASFCGQYPKSSPGGCSTQRQTRTRASFACGSAVGINLNSVVENRE
jgi:hypothetical protein